MKTYEASSLSNSVAQIALIANVALARSWAFCPLAIAALCLWMPEIALAQAQAQLDETEQEIVVTGRRKQAPVAEIGSRLGLTARETPATIEILDSETIRRQGLNTFVQTVRSAAGVISVT